MIWLSAPALGEATSWRRLFIRERCRLQYVGAVVGCVNGKYSSGERAFAQPCPSDRPIALDRPAQTKSGPSGAASSGARASLTQSPCVVIVGGGFAGIEVARALQDSPARVPLIDRHNYTLFQPLLYQVATAALSSADVAAPIRGLLHAANTEVLLDEVIGVDRERSYVRTSGGREIDFSLLVLATGSQYDYFGHDEWAALAPALKTLKDAVKIRSRVLLAFEQAEMCADDASVVP